MLGSALPQPFHTATAPPAPEQRQVLPCRALPPALPLPSQPQLTDALVHVRIAKAKVSQRTRRQANPNLSDIVPLQEDEEFGGTPQTPIELRAQVTASGTALTQLGADWKSRIEAVVSAGLCRHQLGPQTTGTTGRRGRNWHQSKARVLQH